MRRSLLEDAEGRILRLNRVVPRDVYSRPLLLAARGIFVLAIIVSVMDE